MISVCASCSKCVYPTEKVTCFDRPWHKFCFKCQECGMVLNMKNYKGYEKKPYCLAHYPTVRYTQVAETPEHKRLKENSNVLSKAKYQADFQKQKGTKISVSDDVTNEKLKQLKSFQSQTQYQKQFKKEIIGSKTSVPDDVVTNQLKKAQENMSVVRYHKEFNEQIKGTLLSTTEDIKSAYLKDLQNLNDSKYHEDYQKHIRGKKMSLADDIMTSYLKETQSRITSIGYRQRTVSVESTKRKSVVSVDSVDSSVFLDSEAEPGSVEVVEAAEGSTAYIPSESIEQLEAGDEACGLRTENEIGQENAETENLCDETNSDNKFAKIAVEESRTQASAQAEQIEEELADTTDSGIINAAECDDGLAPLSNDMISSHREADDSVVDRREEFETSAAMAPNLEESSSDPAEEVEIKSPQTNKTEVIPTSISDSSSTDLEPGEVPVMTLASSEPQQDLSRDSHVSELASSITQMIDELFEDPPAPHSSDEDLVFPPESSRGDDVLGELEQTRETRSYSTPTDFSTPDRERHNLGSFTSDPGFNSVVHYEAEGNTSSVDSAEASPYSISVGKLKKIKKLSDSINVFRTTLTHGALSRLIKED